MAIPAARRAMTNSARFCGRAAPSEESANMAADRTRIRSAAEPIAERSGRARAQGTAQQQRASGDLGLQFGESELGAQEYQCAVNHRDIEPEQESRGCRHRGDPVGVAATGRMDVNISFIISDLDIIFMESS